MITVYHAKEEIEKIIEQISIAKSIKKRVPEFKFGGGFHYEPYCKKRLKKYKMYRLKCTKIFKTILIFLF